MEAQTKRAVKRLGEILLEMGVITRVDLDTALRRQRINRLSRCPLFSSLPNADLATLSKHFTEVSISTGEQFIKQGEFDPVLYVIAEGRVQVSCLDKTDKEIPIAEVGEGEPIVEMGYFSAGVRAASMVAQEPIHLLRAEYQDLINYFEKAESVALVFMQVVNRRRTELEEIKKREQIDPFAKHMRD